MLARDGHEVTVLERDAAPVPASPQEAFERWEQPGDERFVTSTGRRATMELVVARVAAAEPRLDIRRGVTAAALLTTPLDGLPHVTGVRTDAGEELPADLVVDAIGRRSQLPRLLRAAGAQPLHEEVEDSGFVYYTRFFAGDALPQHRAGLLMPLGTMSVLTLPGDNCTWSVTVRSRRCAGAANRRRHRRASRRCSRHCLLRPCRTPISFAPSRRSSAAWSRPARCSPGRGSRTPSAGSLRRPPRPPPGPSREELLALLA